ncbi:hypothetical protein [Herbiconiux sp. YIM B11900]|uniref:hypothetical protein n=1 Tax=Herbiconiux sp. YIM B11900 TaxID=3404131 RepID=UPI003F877499
MDHRSVRAATRFGLLVRRHEALAAITLGLLALAIGLLRIPPADSDVIWAEDGRVFLAQRLAAGPFQGWFAAYDGYQHLLPRILTDLVVSTLPLASFGLGITIATCVVAGGVAALVYVCSRDAVGWLPARVALALLVVLLPTVTFEVLGDVANVHGLLLWLAPWLVIVRPRGLAGGIALGVVGLLVGLTEIQALVVVPFLLWRLRDRMRWPVRAGLLLGLAGQLLTLPFSARAPRPAGLPDLASTFQGFVVNAMMMPWIGSGHTAALVVRTGSLIVVPVALLGLVVLAYILWRGTPAQRVAGGLLAFGAVAVWSAGFVLNPNPGFYYSTFDAATWQQLGALRYGIVPALFVGGLVVVFAAVLVGRVSPGRAARGRTRRLPRILGVSVLVLGLLLTVWQLRSAVSTIRSGGPSWSAAVTDAREACALPEAPATVEVPILPDTWTVPIACDTLERTP